MKDDARKGGKGRGEGSDSGPMPSDARRGRRPRTEPEPRQIVAVGLMMAGMSRKQIAERLKVDEKTVGRWLHEPAVKRELAAQLTAISAETWSRVTLLASEAWGVFEALLNSPDERIRFRASTWYLDRVLSVLPVKLLLDDGPVTLPSLPPSLLRFVDPDNDDGEASL